jgi:hypothetical protein
VLPVGLLGYAYSEMALLGDSFWSIATGQYILDSGRLPLADPFSFTASRPWVVHMPLAMLLFGATERAVGPLGLQLLGAIVETSALLLIWLLHARGVAARTFLWPGLVLLLWLQAEDLCVRAQLFGDVAFAAWLALAFGLRDTPSLRLAALGFPLGCLWVNLHSSVLAGVALSVALALGELLSRRTPDGWRRARWLVAFATAMLAGCAVNPYGLGLLWSIIELLSSPSTRALDLFSAPSLAAPETWCALALSALALVLTLRAQGLERSIPDVLLLVLLAIAGFTGRRYLPLGAAYALALLGRALATPRKQPARKLTRTELAVAPVFVACSLGLAFNGFGRDKDPFRDVPLEEAAIVLRERFPGRLANAYHFGGFLAYAFRGSPRIFIDGRNQLFDGPVFDDALRLHRGEAHARILEKYGIETVLWESGSPLDFRLSEDPAWSLVRRGRVGVLYVTSRRR